MTCPVNAAICEQHCAGENCTVIRAMTKKGGNVLAKSSRGDHGINFERKRTKPNSGGWSVGRVNKGLSMMTLCAIPIALAY